MVTGSEGQLHKHDSANRDPTFVQCLGTRDVAMRAGASHIGVDKPVAENAVKQYGAETRLLKMSILMVFYNIII